jgi:hypothetical protein
MMFSRSLAVHAGFAPLYPARTLSRIRIWALEHVVSAASPSGDLRWMAAALAVSALAVLEAMVQRQLVLLARHIMGRALQGARFAGALGTADSMVAAVGR